MRYLYSLVVAAFCLLTAQPTLAQNIIPADSLWLSTSNCAAGATACVSGFALSEVANYDISINGQAYTGDIIGCDIVSITAYSYGDLVNNFPNLTYFVENWTVNGQGFTGLVNNVNVLVDSMNIWDPTGNWTLESATQLIIGGNSSNVYTQMDLTVIELGQPVMLGLTNSPKATGTRLSFPTGNYEVIFTQNNTGLTDTLQVNVVCLSTSTEDININELNTPQAYCLDTTELVGPLSSISICAQEDNSNFFINISDANPCVDIIAFAAASETVCVVACDIYNICDTTILNLSNGDTIVQGPYIGMFSVLYDEIPTAALKSFCFDNYLVNDVALASISNYCEDSSNGNAAFSIDNSTLCINYVGVQAGDDTACLLMCNAQGECDTLLVSITVLPLVLNTAQTEYLDVPIGQILDICPDTTGLGASSYTLTDICGGANGLPFDVTVSDVEPCFDVYADFDGDGYACMVLTGDNGVSDTTYYVLSTTSAPTPTEQLLVTDTILVGNDDVYCLDLSLLTFIPDSIALDNGSDNNAFYELIPNSNCVRYTGLQVGLDNAYCVLYGTNGEIDTILFEITIIPQQSQTQIITLLEGDIAQYCVDTSVIASTALSLVNACPVGDNSEMAIDQYCTNLLGVSEGTDTICLVLTSLVLGITDTTYLIVNVVNDIVPMQSDTQVFNLMIGESQFFCIDSSEIGGFVTNISTFCDFVGGDAVFFDINNINLCVEIEATSSGSDTACISICSSTGVCDTTVLIVNVSLDSANYVPPVLSNDFDTTSLDMPVYFLLLMNDNIATDTTFFGIVDSPSNGTLDNVGVGLVGYIPNTNFCGLDTFTYQVCSGMYCDTAMVVVEVKCLQELVFYSAISPNGDGDNEVWVIEGINTAPSNNLQIYNRWGELVFEKENYENNWGGTFQDKILPDGVYYYVFNNKTKSKIHSGFIQLQR